MGVAPLDPPGNPVRTRVGKKGMDVTCDLFKIVGPFGGSQIIRVFFGDHHSVGKILIEKSAGNSLDAQIGQCHGRMVRLEDRFNGGFAANAVRHLGAELDQLERELDLGALKVIFFQFQKIL